MESSQESLFTDETKGGIEVIYSKFIDQRRMDYKSLFGGFDHLKVITFSYGLGFVETVADMFEDVEIIIGSMNTVRPDIVEVAMHQKLEMKRLSKRKRLVERVKDGSVRIYFNMRKMSHEKLYILYADDGRCRIITGSANLSKRAFTGGQYEEITCFDGDAVMFDNRLARFESLKGMSSTTPLEPAVMVDFASVAGDSEGELKPELAKRSVPIRTEVRIDREVGTVGKKTLSDSIGRLTTAFFLEYLARMEPLVEEMEGMIRVGARDYLPDLLNLSSVTLREMFEEAGESDTWNMPLTFRDFIGETATARVAREKLLEAWRVDPSQFKVRPNNQGVEYRPDGSDADRTLKFEVKAIYDELPAYLNAGMVNSVIVFKDTAALEAFLGVRLDKSLGAMVRRAVRAMHGGKAD